MLDKFCRYLETEKRYSPHTITAYKTDIAGFFEFADISPNNADEVNHQLVRGWISALMNGTSNTGDTKSSKKISARSVNRKIAALRSFYSYLLRQGMVKHSPLAKIVTPKTAKRLPVFLKEDKLNEYLDGKEKTGDYESVRDLTIMELLYGTGMRVSELVALQDNSVDFNNKTIKVRGKGNKERYIPLSSHLETILHNYLAVKNEFCEDNPNPSLFLTSKAKQIYVKLVYLIVHEQLTAGGFTEKRSPHVLRHSFATHLLNHEADLNGIKELLGHANLSATQIYTHNSFKKMKAVYQKAHPHATNEDS